MSRTIEAIIKHTGANPEKDSSAKYQTMKAIRIHNYGGPEVLQYEDAPRPQPQAGEVLVRVHAAGVNPIDWKVREGHMKDFWPHKFPLILGWDLSGVVEELGPNPAAAGRFKSGDEVYSLPDPTRKGAYVFATASTKNQDLLRELGVDEPIDYTQQRFEDVARDIDVVLDTLGGETQARSWSVLKNGGVLVSLVQPPSEEKAKELGVR